MAQDSMRERIKEMYGKIAISGNCESCCIAQECSCSDSSPKQALLSVGYDNKALDSIPQSSILGVGCGAHLNFAHLKQGEIVIDLASGAGIVWDSSFCISRKLWTQPTLC